MCYLNTCIHVIDTTQNVLLCMCLKASNYSSIHKAMYRPQEHRNKGTNPVSNTAGDRYCLEGGQEYVVFMCGGMW